ncbi:hypothetical protein LTR09_003528 [Extremus antarcticus]|uniref:Uncharacterized protein n=1 Tax=Extremus antarcticus TaxID=702011 RepID=A0AAJ0DKE9_9PEZI|nr:hypothetical protein LTR09_003528 [Extremus antarcticus]
MGGTYPSGWEYNFGGVDPDSTAYVLDHWPKTVPTTYSGFELGRTIESGQELASHSPPDSPGLAAYQWYVGRGRTVEKSWDPVTALYGILGLDWFGRLGVKAPFAYANTFGYNIIMAANGSNAWINDTRVTNQHWLRLADGVKEESVACLLAQFYARDPVVTTCLMSRMEC